MQHPLCSAVPLDHQAAVKSFFAPVLIHMSCPCTAQLHSYFKVLAKMRGGCRRTRCDRWLIHSHATQQSLSSLSPRTVTDSQYAYAKEEYRAHTIQTSGSDPPASAISSSSMLVCTFRVLDAQRTYYSPSFYASYGGHASSARETCACAGSRPDDAAVAPQLKRVEGS